MHQGAKWLVSLEKERDSEESPEISGCIPHNSLLIHVCGWDHSFMHPQNETKKELKSWVGKALEFYFAGLLFGFTVW